MPDQHAAAGRRRDLAAGFVRFGKRIKLLEEIDESGDQQPFDYVFAMEPHHQRDQVTAFVFGLGDETAEVALIVLDVGVGQQQVGCAGIDLPCRPYALMERPGFARPAGCQPFPGNDRKRIGPAQAGRRVACDASGAVGAAVIDHDDLERPRIVLRQ
jgi:hypothetical protein